MRWRPLICLVSSALALAVGFWLLEHQWPAKGPGTTVLTDRSGAPTPEARDSPQPSRLSAADNSRLLAATGYRLSNTTKTLSELERDPQAILLENAWIDTSQIALLGLPEDLRSRGDPGSYIVQSRGQLDSDLRNLLTRTGAIVVSYVPNNSCLVRASEAVARQLQADSRIQAVLPYEPYYKLKSSLLELAATHEPLPINAEVNLLIFPNARQTTLERVRALGAEILSEDRSPFGPVLRVRPPAQSLATLAGLEGVQELEFARTRVAANDLSRATVGAASDTVTTSNYLGLTGSNVWVNVNDTGVDANHPDLQGRVFGDSTNSLFDTDGHGTHVAGIIGGSGLESPTVINASGSVVPASTSQFRGIAPNAKLFSIRRSGSDAYLQQTGAETNAMISNNSWNYDTSDYDLSAASYDAATRDALPVVTGSQSVSYVFSAGNQGSGADDGHGGSAGTIRSPGTAKNVITVGAIEQARHISNVAWACTTNGSVTCTTNQPWSAMTGASNRVAAFSSRGNVGIGIEGKFGRFKPDVVAPGTFMISTRSLEWDAGAYYSPTNTQLEFYANFGNSLAVLSNLNNSIGQPNYYRFESGTSMAAAAVSGTLALIQEFFERRLGRKASPALMKALLINGARSLGNLCDFQVNTKTNFQGWGLIHLPTSLPGSLTNQTASPSSMLVFGQNPTNALATDQSHTRLIALSSGARLHDLRVTLVWTDPPGYPLASVKLVNDLDLLVTNLDTGDVYFGNDIASGSAYNLPWDTNFMANVDAVNNVENVYLSPALGPLGANYSITVTGRRVNVNAVAANPNDTVQDYALIISSGDGEILDGLTLVSDAGPNHGLTEPLVTVPTNMYAGISSDDFGAVLTCQHAGANSPLLGTNTVQTGLGSGVITLGLTNQWHFYALSNDTDFTNAAFITFQPQVLSRAGAILASSNNLALPSGDIDLYVSQDPGLTNLDPEAVANAFKSLGRDGNESIVLSNATPGWYYVGVKCEDQQGADYGVMAVVSRLPFATNDNLGNQVLRGFPAPMAIPDGTPQRPGWACVAAVSTGPITVHRVIVTNVVSHELTSDLLGGLEHGNKTVVLNNHSANGAVTNQAFIYDDSQELNVPGSLPADGPGSLRDFAGTQGSGLWLFTQQDTVPGHVGTNESLTLFLENEPDLSQGALVVIEPESCREDYVSVPLDGASLAVSASIASGTGPVLMQLCPPPLSGGNCQTGIVAGSSSTSLTLDKSSASPLNGGICVIKSCNLGPDPVSINESSMIGLLPGGIVPLAFTSSSSMPILDNAATFSQISVAATNPIIAVNVGVRIDHPRISDLELDLVSPNGTRVLLDQNRGGFDTNGLGANVLLTNVTPVSSSGGQEASTNSIDTGQTSGTINIDYNFYALPDEMHVYYDGARIYDSGMVSWTGTTNLNYGPGSSTIVTIVMNEGGNSDTNTAWDYRITSTRPGFLYTTFTEDPNLASTAIKFAPPPFNTPTPNPAGVNGIFYFPEESLSAFAGAQPAGDWLLELWDTRASANVPLPRLLGWQLQFVLADTVPLPTWIRPANIAISSIIASPADIQFQWIAPTNTHFQVQWTPSLSPPIWIPFAGTVTSSTGNFFFIDDGSQTGGFDLTRFYRLVVLP